MLLTASAALLLSFALPQSQDRIFLRNGQVLAVDKVNTETYSEVTYRKGGSDGRKPANEVLSVSHSLNGRPLADYADAMELMESGDFRRAIGRFEEALQNKDLAGEARYAWTKQHGLWNMLLCSAALGDLNAIIATNDRLLAAVPNTFFYPQALVKKAEALQDKKDLKGAEGVFKQLQGDVGSKGLHEEWARKAELGLVLLDGSLAPADKQRRLEGIAEKNKASAEFADVASRARVEVGNAMVDAGQYQDAKVRFQAILDAGTTDSAILAGAYSGLGDCAFNLGVQAQSDPKKSSPLFEDAALNFLRVAATYPAEYRLAARAMCFAGMSMNYMGKRPDAMQMARKLKLNYPNSVWKQKLFTELQLAG
ncbi:MAG: tetratricopeptide repeat protein [Planctomycetota bacterium]|nr:tetratricopeptide repeat protein [Planctomycetota bacterium]